MEKDQKSQGTKTAPVFSRLGHLLFSSKKRIAVVVIVVALLIYAGTQIFASGSQTPQYQTATVTEGTVLQTVSESGNIASNSQAGVGSPTSGILTEVDVKDGQYVNKGDNLFKVQSTATAQEIASAYATYESAIEDVDTSEQGQIADQSKLEQDRQAVLTAQDNVNFMNGQIGGSINNKTTNSPWNQLEINAMNSTLTSSRETFNSDQMKYVQANQAIAASTANEQSAYYSYEATQDSTVTAPFSGIVANIGYKEGDEITASSGNLSSDISTSTTSSSNPVLYIGDFSKPYVKVQASEVDITKIKDGQQVTISLNAFQNQTFVGTVDQIDEVGTVTSGVVTFNVYIDFAAPPTSIKPGMSATVNIQTARADNTLMVPSTAVQTSSTGQNYVQVLKNGQVQNVNVTTGITSDTDTQILSGLTNGESVILGSAAAASSTTSPFTTQLGGAGGAAGGGFRGGGGGAVFRGGL